MNLNVSLRLKVTIINTIVLIACSLILTIGTYFSTAKSIDSLSNALPANLMPSTSQNAFIKRYNIENNEVIPAQITAQAAEIEKAKLATTSITYMLVVIVLGCIITYLTTGKSLASVKKLNNQIKDISEHNLSEKIKEEGSNDEIKELTKSFNKMLGRIDEAFESQKQFSSNVAHELRTPLAVIQMKIDVFNKRKEVTNEDYKKLVQVIENNNNRLSKLVEELLSISNKCNIELNDKIDFNKMIKSIVNEFKEVSLQKKISIDIDEKVNLNTPIYGYANEQLLYRAIYNLVENSIKYNNENGNVKIYLKQDNKFIDIIIKDSGVGIKEEDYYNIFKPFYRTDKSRSRKTGGSGLGLSIVKTIIDQHNGSIKVKSSEIGSEFTIKIPYN